MPARVISIEGRVWHVYPSGFLTQSVGDEYGLIFVTGHDESREVRVTRYSPTSSRAREQSLAELDDHALITLFGTSQSSARSPEAGYRA